MKTSTFFVLAFIGLLNLGLAQTPDWAWVKQADCTNPYTVHCEAIAADKINNIYTANVFNGPFVFAGDTVKTLTATGQSLSYGVVLHFDQAGNELWARVPGGNGFCYAVAADGKGSVYAAGLYIDSLYLPNDTFRNSRGSYVYLIKYDSLGNELWARSNTYSGTILQTAGNTAYAVSTDVSGNALVTGAFGTNKIMFGNDTLTGRGWSDVFLVKYDPYGNVLWAQSGGGNLDDYPNDMGTDKNGNTYVVGDFKSSNLRFGNTTLPNSDGNSDFFIVKYDSTGNMLWAHSGSSDNTVRGYSVAPDKFGNVYLCGSYDSGYVNISGTMLQSNRGNNMFLVKYDIGGNVIWAENIAPGCIGYGLATDAAGSVYLTGGTFNDTLTLGAAVLIQNPAYAATDIFVAKIDTAGQVIWGKHTTGTGAKGAIGIALGNDDIPYIGGAFRSSVVNFDNTTFSHYGADSNATRYFVGRLNSCSVPGAPLTVADTICKGSFATLQATGTHTIGWYSADSGGVYLQGGSSFTTAALSQATTFYVQDSSCIASARTAVTVYVNAGPNAVVTATGATLSTGVFAGYQWLLNGEPIAGANGQNYIANANGSYAVAVEDSNGCRDTSASYVITKTGVNDMVATDYLKIFPDPVVQLLLIETSYQHLQQITIYDMKGQRLYQSAFENSSDISMLSAGVYVLEVKGENTLTRQRFIKQ